MKTGHSFRKSMKRLLYVLPILVLLCFVFCISSYAQSLAYGSLSVDSNPRGARVYLDNDYKGDTPLNLKNISVGQYSIKLVLPGYQEWVSSIVVLPILTVKISTDLVRQAQSAYGSISVNSNPQEARVYLDNAYKGHTPINLRDIPIGRHTIRIILPGYQEWTGDISVSSSQTARITANLTSQSDYGSLSVNSNPKGADIYLGDVYEGLTPLDLSHITPGQYTIRVILPGYQEWRGDISVSPSQRALVSVDLVPQPTYGSISVSCDQSGAKIFLDGTYKRTTSTIPVMLEDVKNGEHELVIIKDGFRAWVEDVEIYAGEVSFIDVKMTEIFN